jgi:hypothetical protein
VTRKKRLRKERRRIAAGKPANRPGILFGRETIAAVKKLERDGIIEVDRQRYLSLTAKGTALGAARRQARALGLDPDEVAPV